jgi:HD-like signal output (HDOD) protein
MAFLRRAKRQLGSGAAEVLADLLDGYALPSFPRVITQAIERVSSVNADMGAVAETLKDDPGLSVHLLRLVNSASFAPRRPIVDLHQAVMMLGRNQLESMLISMAVNQALPKGPTPGFDTARFWAAASQRATVAATYANLFDPIRRSENYTAALLCDLALPVLAQQVPGYADVLDEVSDRGVSLIEMEEERYGWNHQTVGALMCENWEFPVQLTESIGAHHDPVAASDILPLVKVVATVRDFGDPASREAFLSDVITTFGLPGEQAAPMLEDALSDAAATASLFA